jgi:hypothetical protein
MLLLERKKQLLYFCFYHEVLNFHEREFISIFLYEYCAMYNFQKAFTALRLFLEILRVISETGSFLFFFFFFLVVLGF